jgi:hypothetical protein
MPGCRRRRSRLTGRFGCVIGSTTEQRSRLRGSKSK